ncbi:hypothetical protein L7F22_066063 [Adiantum nelumboides]|nr:hypothetical protein [Adiantum nelumboides]
MIDMYSRNVLTMSWNVRGLCALARQMYVKKLIQSEKLDIVMLQETKTGALSLQVKGYACITSKADRGSRGCMTPISNAYKVKEVLQPDCGRWIACQVCIQNEWIGVINVYAPNCPQERKLMWGQLSQIDWDLPLLFAGDWNCEDAELQSNEWIAWKNKFDAVDVASLQGCDALAYPTWTNRHLKSGFVARRLDRIYLSDKGSWVSHEMQGELINMKDAWVSAREGILHPVERWQAGMNAIIKLTKAKGKAHARAKRRAKCGLEHVLQCTRATATQSPNDPIVLHLLQVFESTAKDLETQKAEAARVQTNLYWLKIGDAPNKTFFKALRAKKDSELITAQRKPDGGVTEDETEIKEMFKDSLSGIVGSPMTWNEQLQQKLNTFLEPMDSKINEEKKLLLGRPFSVYEVETVVKAMKKEKTPGPDGIQAEVLQELIKYAGQDLCDLLYHWRREGTIQPEFNQGLIKLIPKGQDKMEVKNYRPLTMLNTVYKVMAKALALRVRTVVSQGCPLVPLLFAIAIDPLLRNLDLQLQRQAINPLPLPQGQSFLAQLFADDNCNIVKCEHNSIAALMEVYGDFCDVSGSRIAPHKTECLRLTYKEDTGVLNIFGLVDAGIGTIIREAMKNCQAAALLNPQLAKTLEKKGYAVFKNIWDAASQDWGIDQRRWRTLKPREKVFLSQVIQGIKEDWPTSFLVATQLSISNWDLKECRRSVPTQSWIRNMVIGWGDITFYSGESQLGRSQSGRFVADGVSHHPIAPDVTHAGKLSSLPSGIAGAYH